MRYVAAQRKGCGGHYFETEQKQACCVCVWGGGLVKICGIVLFQRDQSRFDTFLTNASNAFCKM